MSTLQNKIDFTVIVTATKANPNGDPLFGNRPRESLDGYGEISDVCIKRKIRNRLQSMGEKIFVQSDDLCDDGCKHLKERAERNAELKAVTGKNSDKEKFKDIACKEWIDVRSFGQVFAFKVNGEGVSVGIRGPVTIQTASSVSPVEIVSTQITKSVSSETEGKKGSDTMGTKHRVEFGMYIINGSMSCQLAEKTGFSDEDAEKIKEALLTLFEGDSSSARPDGSMEVCRIYWWKHDSKTPKYSSAKVFHSVKIALKDGVVKPSKFEDYDISLEQLDGLDPEVYDLQ